VEPGGRWRDRARGPAGLELAAEAFELDALARLGEGLLADARWDAAGEGAMLAETRHCALASFAIINQKQPCWT
jgi:hypothetical protein